MTKLDVLRIIAISLFTVMSLPNIYSEYVDVLYRIVTV